MVANLTDCDGKKEKRQKPTNTRNENRDVVHLKDVQKKIREYYEYLKASKLSNLNKSCTFFEGSLKKQTKN